ncbi:MAG: von Willebrand factor type A domain-containing protein [Saprospiraceae bacterium]|nr:von Willebrand factor type A domain-containing protein [Saprospiraceae bacterium]MCB9327043.1 von Willebrand factor type A domain-containing protein [Lewinellaceae bacterium]
MKNLFYFITAAVVLFAAAAFVTPQTSTYKGSFFVQDKDITITGTVRDNNGNPLMGASVLEKGTQRGAMTDIDGKYSLNVTNDKAIIVFSYIGFTPREIQLGKSQILDVIMTVSTTLEECIVVGYTKETASKEYPVTTTAEKFQKNRRQNKKIFDALSGKVTGVRIQKDDEVIQDSRSETKNYDVDGKKNQKSPTPPAPQTLQVAPPPPPNTTTPKQMVKADEPKPAPAPQPTPPVSMASGDVKKPKTAIETGATTIKMDTLLDYAAERYEEIYENPFLAATKTPLSTFSIDVDAAAYSNMRRFVNNGALPPKDAVRIEEMINYFNYDYPEPKGEHPFEIITEIADCPWQKGHKLLHIGLQGKRIAKADLPATNLVFLIDVSGSMNSSNKLPLLQQSLNLLIDNLRQNDFVSIVVYAGAAGVVLNPTNGSDKPGIKAAINRLQAGGSTAGGAGIELAYNMARKNFIRGGNNRVILATDGDFNVGVSNDDALVKLIEKERESGVFLTVLGFGMGNYQDAKMQKLADKGNGNHAYIDNIDEAKKVLINEFGGTIFAIAKDVKLQLEFNQEQVKGYRLIGYENRLLADKDFDDDTKDAGELGAGHTVTALYEIIPANYQTPYIVDTDQSRVDLEPATAFSGQSNELVHIKFRYKEPDGKKSKLLEKGAVDMNIPWEKSSDNFRWSAAVAEFGLLLRDSKYQGASSWNGLKKMAENAKGKDTNGYRAEMIRLVEDATILAKKPMAGK